MGQVKKLTLKWLIKNPWITVTLDCPGAWCGARITSEVCRFCSEERYNKHVLPHHQAYWDMMTHDKACPVYNEEESYKLYEKAYGDMRHGQSARGV